MFFSVAAVLFAGFGIAGLVIGGNEEYQELIVRGVDNAVPGVLDTGEGGLAAPAELFSTEGLNVAVTLSLLAAVVTSLSWVHGLRAGIRSIWDRPIMAENVVLVKIRDLGMMILLVVVVLSSAVLGVISHGFIDEIFDVLDWDAAGATYWLSRGATLAIVFGLDMVVAFLLMRVASRLVIPVGCCGSQCSSPASVRLCCVLAPPSSLRWEARRRTRSWARSPPSSDCSSTSISSASSISWPQAGGHCGG
ncbi:YihY/virulence factor BrkB family protein [Nesterenkonia pannonica]|uniref:YhjD/YihY/BrkB family envelope integrity protein n=1 Tax=Nesterenkonia pannonica TaxID=1548602 RepID=UPI002164C89B|nr:YhjD/YihY/BrkB family envelope integrity protein [Nesterenkonia pannonica]